jgi:hypothetical protein
LSLRAGPRNSFSGCQIASLANLLKLGFKPITLGDRAKRATAASMKAASSVLKKR